MVMTDLHRTAFSAQVLEAELQAKSVALIAADAVLRARLPPLPPAFRPSPAVLASPHTPRLPGSPRRS